MPKDITGVDVWINEVPIALDGELIQMLGAGGEGNERIYQFLANRDVHTRQRITTVEPRVLPPGGAADAMLVKTGGADFAAAWTTNLDGGTY